MRIRIALLTLALVAVLPSSLVAADAGPFNATGTLIDVMCSEGSSQADADKHSAKCALMDHCAKSGFGIMVDGKFHKFDAEGNKQAEAIFRSTKKADHITATVEGTLEANGDIKVTRLTEK